MEKFLAVCLVGEKWRFVFPFFLSPSDAYEDIISGGVLCCRRRHVMHLLSFFFFFMYNGILTFYPIIFTDETEFFQIGIFIGNYRFR